jgi:GDP-4-dehydro-6-deoxy-D-mannose reductase
VIHLAAQSSTAESWRDPQQTYRDNVMAQVSLLEACRTLDTPPMVVVAGSSDEYGMPCHQVGSIAEEHRLAPLTPYGVSKAAQDLMARQYFLSAQVPTCVFRPFLQIGPGRSDRFFSGAFARQVVAIEMGKQPPVIEVGNIELIRDMTDVRDVARACTSLMTHGATGEAYNVSSGVARRVGDLLETMIQASGIQAEVRQKPIEHRSVEPDRLVGDSTKLRSLTGWKPEISFRDSAHDMLEDWRDRYRTGLV